MAEFLSPWDDSSNAEHWPLPLLSSKSNISSYYNPDEGWSDDKLYALFGEEPEPMEEDEEDDKEEEDEDEEDGDEDEDAI
jgi:hypothetical protein